MRKVRKATENVLGWKVRQSNLELLRIVSMILIIAYHYVIHSGVESYLWTEGFGAKKLLLHFLSFGGKLGVTLFVLITGYFMINSKVKFSKIVKLCSQVGFYSILMALLAVGFGRGLSKEETLAAIFPIIYNEYWFVTTYCILYAMSGFINKFVKSCSVRTLRRFLLVGIGIFYIIPTLTGVCLDPMAVAMFVITYVMAAYIRLHGAENLFEIGVRLPGWPKIFSVIFSKMSGAWKWALGRPLLAGIGLYLGTFVLAVILRVVDGSGQPAGLSEMFGLQQSVSVLAVAVLIFVGVLRMQGGRIRSLEMQGRKYRVSRFILRKLLRFDDNGHSTVVNFVAAGVFAVYLVHDNILFKYIMWEKMGVATVAEYGTFWQMLVHVILCMVVIFMVGVGLDALWRKIVRVVVRR